MTAHDDRPGHTGAPINEPYVWTEHYVCVARPGGGKTLGIDDDDVERYRRDPDQFAADEFGLTKAEYRLWVALDGMAFCSERTKAARLCRNCIGNQLGAAEWKALHRQFVCHAHGGAPP
jgi:hypothetical protein